MKQAVTGAAIAAAATLVLNLSVRAEDRSFDGTGNNLSNSTLGSANTDYRREASGAHYTDGVSSPAGASRPSARFISNALMTQGESSVPDARNITALVYTWGQFIDHDLDLRNNASPTQPMNIAVPTGDVWFDPSSTGTQVIPMSRSGYNSASGFAVGNPRQQTNTVTSYLDGSMVYGSDSSRAGWLRTGTSGQLKFTAAPTGAMLPTDDGSQVMDGPFGPSTSSSLYVAGDTRANEQIGITSIQTLALREHNRQATLIARANPGWSDEQVYQRARKITSAEIAAITYNEFVPALLGSGALPGYSGYNGSTDPSVSNAFAAVGFRIGHSQLDDDIERVGPDGNVVAKGNLPLRNAFFNPAALSAPGTGGVDAVLRGFAGRVEQSVDLLMIDDIRNFLFAAPGQGGMDLAAIDVQRGRDHGLADYNTMRQDFGLAKVATFAQISSDPSIQAQLQQLYGTVDDIDPFVGALAEDHAAGSSVGPLARAIIADQFKRTRDGDRLFYMNDPSFNASDLAAINSFKLSDLIRRNTFVRNIQDNAFFAGTANVGPTWTAAAGSSWQIGSNWAGSTIPNASGAVANFLTNSAGALNIPLDSPVTLGSMVLSNSSGVNVSPGTGGSLVFDNLGSNAGILISAGSHAINANVTLADSLSVLFWGNGTFALAGSISESNAGRSITIDGSGAGPSGGGAVTISNANTFTGGVSVTHSQVNLNHANAQGALGSVASARGNGEIVLGFTPTASHRFDVGDLGAIQGNSAQLGALTVGNNLTLAPGAMIVRQVAGGTLPASLPNNASYYAAYTTNVTGAGAAITVGATSGTPFKGIGSDRAGNVTWGAAADTLTLSGSADLVALGSSTLTVAAKISGGSATDTLTKRGTGTVKLTNSANNFAANNVTVESGTLNFAYSSGMNVPASTNLTVNSDAALRFPDNFTTTINGAVVNNGSVLKPLGSTSQLIFHGPALTGRGQLVAQETQAPGSAVATSALVAHAFLFNNGAANSVGGVGGADPNTSSPIIAVDGASTSVHLTGLWDGDGSTETSWVVLTNGAHFFVDAGAALDTIPDAGSLRPFVARGDGTGVFDFGDGFVANQHDDVPGTLEFYVWSPGNITWITRNSLNFPDSNIEFAEENSHWITATHDQVVECGVPSSRSYTIETQTNVTFARAAAWRLFDGTKVVTKTGSGTLTIAGENATGTGATSRALTAAGSTIHVTDGHFVEMTDMGSCATGAGANGVFGAPGLPDADDVITTNYLWNVILDNPATTAELNASQHLLSLKVNTGATANQNAFTYGGNTATAMTVKTLGVDVGAGTLNIGASNSATATTSFAVAPAATFNKGGAGALSIIGSTSFGSSSAVNLLSGTTSFAMTTGATATVGSSPPSLAVSQGAAVTVNASVNDPFTDDVTTTRHVDVVNDGTFSLTNGSIAVGNLDGSGYLRASNATQLSAARLRQGTFNLQGNASATVRTSGIASATSRIGTLLLAGGTTPTATLDLNDNDLILTSGTRATAEAQIAYARDGGAWDRPGIASSSARNNANHTTGLGLVTGAEYKSIYGPSSNFDGFSVADPDLLIKYTWNGDANLDGVVSFDDYVKIDTGFNAHLTGWINGDFNYSGSVGFDDYVLIDIAFNQQNGTLSRAVDWISGDDRSRSGRAVTGVQSVIDHFETFGAEYGRQFLAAVPEPSALALMGVTPFLRRRRRTSGTLTGAPHRR